MIEFFNEDCMEGMKRYTDKYFDLAIVDPPYGIGAENGTGDYAKAASPKGKKWDQIPNKKFFSRLGWVSKNQIIWGGNYFHLQHRRGWICWYKTDEVKGRDFSEFELAWTSFDRPARHIELKPFIRNGERIHPTQKPVALYRWLLKNYAKEGNLILDTHLGSGSTAIACYDMGFDLVGFEIDKDYYEGAMKRLEEKKRQGKLFHSI
mgnify:CR=1 FL=1